MGRAAYKRCPRSDAGSDVPTAIGRTIWVEETPSLPHDTLRIPCPCYNPRTQPSSRSPHIQDFPACPSKAIAFTAACGSPEPAWHRGKNDSSSPSAPLGAGWEPISASLPIRDRLTRISIAATTQWCHAGHLGPLSCVQGQHVMLREGGGWCCGLAEWHRLLGPFWGRGNQRGMAELCCASQCALPELPGFVDWNSTK